MQSRGDTLIKQLSMKPTDEGASELLDEFFSGYPVKHLRGLLTHRAEEVVKVGAWLASELGDRASPVLQEVGALLTHPSPYVQSFSLDAVLVAAAAEHGPLIARAIFLLDDMEEVVRWKALRFLTNASVQQLQLGLTHLNSAEYASIVKWLLAVIVTQAPGEIMNMAGHPDRRWRFCAAAAAARVVGANRAPLEHASASLDPEVSSFAREELMRTTENS
jgi:hypothetical protein